MAEPVPPVEREVDAHERHQPRPRAPGRELDQARVLVQPRVGEQRQQLEEQLEDLRDDAGAQVRHHGAQVVDPRAASARDRGLDDDAEDEERDQERDDVVGHRA
ncbi:MAG: hypothetical protein IPH07_30690 [Deltaproteobacteria bacterium]|nr:hypothetical protein [Deltaproteobacteria bacterium]